MALRGEVQFQQSVILKASCFLGGGINRTWFLTLNSFLCWITEEGLSALFAHVRETCRNQIMYALCPFGQIGFQMDSKLKMIRGTLTDRCDLQAHVSFSIHVE